MAQEGDTKGTEASVSGEAGAAPESAEQGLRSDRPWSANAIHLLRTTQVNTLTLSQMADQKANIMIGATFVVFSLAVTRFTGEAITLASLCLAATAFLSSLCAMVAVMPTTAAPSPSAGDKPNLLFFGHFARVDEQEWQASLMQELQQDDTVFETMMHDIYQNGRVLHQRKYRFLAYGYRILIGGLCLTMLVYAGEYLAEATRVV